MIHVTALAGAIIWLGLNGLLWYTRPSDLLSLLGSSILGAIFSAHSLFICNDLITALTRSRTLDNDQPMSASGPFATSSAETACPQMSALHQYRP